MSPVHPLFLVAATAFALILCALLARLRRAPPSTGRYASIDGLRGYLALFVFFHHATITYFFVQTGIWRLPPSRLFTHLGEASVAFFFMITAFLFYGKALDSRAGGIDWLRFFTGRVLRLLPLYAVLLAIILILVAIASGGQREVSFAYLARCIAQWSVFTIFGTPSINGVNAWMMVSGVTWTLPYEWFFYLAMPLLALTCRVRVAPAWVAVGVGGLAIAVAREASPFFAVVFACGAGAAIAVRSRRFVRFCATSAASVIVVVCLGILVAGFDTAYDYLALALLAIAFAMIAGGANLFGVLSANVSHVLGELSYGMYLLHGPLLFVTSTWIVGHDSIRAMEGMEFWGLLLALTVILLVTAAAAYRWIELPAIAMTSRATVRLRRLAPRPSLFAPGRRLVDPLVDEANDPVCKP